VLDTAGLRESADLVEAEGIRRARAEMSKADRVLFVIDCGDDPQARAFADQQPLLPADVPVTLVFNKTDLGVGLPMSDTITGPPRVYVSARTGSGLDLLRAHLKDSVSFQTAGNGSISARRRHLEALARARAHVESGAAQLDQHRAGELVAEELRLAQQALDEITGIFSADDLLGRIFGSFCIGK
jgi:tRNA modification GTPase